jgi:hypothetical protein
MPGTEPVVTEDHLHLALAALRQSGAEHLLSHIQAHEPHLVEHVRAISNLLKDDLARTCLSLPQARRIVGAFESLAAVLTFALRLAYAVRLGTVEADSAADPDRPDPSLN